MPLALSLGIDYNLFWTLNPSKLKPFLKAKEMQQKEKNHELWLQGAYFNEAISIAIGNALRGKNDDCYEYSKVPYGEEKPVVDEISTEDYIENERLKAELFFNNWVNSCKKI